MPHYSNYGGTYLSAQPADELTGTFNALNETTNFKPTQREEIGIIHPSYMPTQGDEIGVIHPSYKPDPRGYDTGPIGSLSETFGDGDPKMLSPISGEGPFKPQGIDAKGSVIVDDKHFKPSRGGDSLTGEGRPTNSWRNADPSPFEDRHVGDYDANDAVFGMRENIGISSDSFGCGENNPISTGQPVEAPLMHQGAMNSVWLKDLAGNMTETFEPLPGMDSFGRSLNPVLELGTNWCPGGPPLANGKFDFPTDNIAGSASPGGDDI